MAPDRSRATSRSAFDEAVFLGLVAALAVTPAFSGGSSLLGSGLNALMFGLLVAAYEAGLLVRRQRHPVAPIRVALPGGLFIVLAGWILLQIVPWTPEGWHHPLWEMTSEALGQPVASRISLAPEEGVRGLVRLLTAAGAFWLALQLGRSQGRARRLLWAMVLISVFYALLGFAALVLRPSWLIALGVDGDGPLNSTFPDADAFATYAGMGLVLALGLLIDTYRWAKASRQAPLRYRLSALLEATVKLGFIQILMCLVLSAALIASASRMGFLATAIGCIILVVLIVVTFGRGHAVAASAVALVAVAGAALLLRQVFMFDRIAGMGGAGIRLAVSQRALDATADVPWTGFGFGSFERVFPMYRDGSMLTDLGWDSAHNTVVELIFELGFPGAALFAVLVLAVVGRIGWNITHRSVVPMLSLVALAASALILLTAVAGASLKIQASVLSYWTLLGVGLAQSWSARVDTAG